MLKKAFKEISETGYHFLYLRSIGKCSCCDGDDIFDSEPDPFCFECYGTGQRFNRFVTEKLRFNYTSNGGNSKIELQSFELIKEQFLTIYFPHNYDKISYLDIIAMIKHDDKGNVITPIQPLIYYKIKSIDDFVDTNELGERFEFKSVKLKSLNFLSIKKGETK